LSLSADGSDVCNVYLDLPLFEIARVLVRFDHVARVIVNANQQFSDGVISSVISLPDYAPQTLRIRNFY
jgi:hypothetical protein